MFIGRLSSLLILVLVLLFLVDNFSDDVVVGLLSVDKVADHVVGIFVFFAVSIGFVFNDV